MKLNSDLNLLKLNLLNLILFFKNIPGLNFMLLNDTCLLISVKIAKFNVPLKHSDY